MEVHVALGQVPRLADVDDLRRFSVIAAAGPDALPDLAEALRGTLDFENDGHAWVALDWLLDASGRSATPEWRAGFDAMSAYAAKQGWMRDAPAAIRGHVVWQGSAPSA